MQDHGTAKRGVLLRAKNGDVIGFDDTGLRMNLSDSVIADIHRRLPVGQGDAAIDPAVLGDVDAWNLRQRGDWYVFSANLPGAQGPRQFRRAVKAEVDASAPDIIADTAGAVYGLLALGGTRRAVTAAQWLLSARQDPAKRCCWRSYTKHWSWILVACFRRVLGWGYY